MRAAERIPAPVLAINPQPAPQSGQVQVSGKGFASGESVTISVARDGNTAAGMLVLTSTVSTGDGAFDPVLLTLPDELQSGAHAIDAVGQTSGRHSTGTLWIRAPQPWLVVDSYDVPQYGDLGLVAGGFEPMDQVQFSLEPAAGATVHPSDWPVDDRSGGERGVDPGQVASARRRCVHHGVARPGQCGRASARPHVTPLKPTVELSPGLNRPGVPVQVNEEGGPNRAIRSFSVW